MPYRLAMSLETVAYPHLDSSKPGRLVIAGKNFKVIHLIREHVAYGWTAEELALNHPQLTLGEVYSALAYYHDHKAELDAEIARQEKEFNAQRDAAIASGQPAGIIAAGSNTSSCPFTSFATQLLYACAQASPKPPIFSVATLMPVGKMICLSMPSFLISFSRRSMS